MMIGSVIISSSKYHFYQRLREPSSCIIIFLVNILSLRHPSSNSPKPDEANWTLLGIGEILLDQGYGKRTVLQGIERLPFGHQFDLDRSGTFKVSAFVNFARKPNLDSNERDAKEQIKKAIERSLAEIPEKALLLFSGGVDSTFLLKFFVDPGGNSSPLCWLLAIRIVNLKMLVYFRVNGHGVRGSAT